MNRLSVVVVVLLVASPAWSQEDELNPDRPGVGTSATTVPRGAVQVESGVDNARERRAGEPTQRRTSLAATVRYGLLDGVELRLDGEPVVDLRGADDATNVGDLLGGAKLRVLEGGEGMPRPRLALLPLIKVPTAPDPIGSERADFFLLGLASWNFGRITTDVNAGLGAIGQRDPDGYLLQAIVIGSLQLEVTDAVTLLAELFYNSPTEREGTDLVGAVGGVSYKVTKNVALDAAVLTSLAGRGPDYRVEAGITIRFRP
jgi:hypothetical protein